MAESKAYLLAMFDRMFDPHIEAVWNGDNDIRLLTHAYYSNDIDTLMRMWHDAKILSTFSVAVSRINEYVKAFYAQTPDLMDTLYQIRDRYMFQPVEQATLDMINQEINYVFMDPATVERVKAVVRPSEILLQFGYKFIDE